MVDLSKKMQDLTADEIRELKDESDRVSKDAKELYNKLFELSMNPNSQRLPNDFRGRDGAVYRWKEVNVLMPVTEKVRDAVVE
jgi:hypothetical protein